MYLDRQPQNMTIDFSMTSLSPTNMWYHYDNSRFEKDIERYVTFPIGTSSFFEEKGKKEQEKLQPRLLMVSVDVETGAIVTFDS